jgi:hypothetical protein
MCVFLCVAIYVLKCAGGVCACVCARVSTRWSVILRIALRSGPPPYIPFLLYPGPVSFSVIMCNGGGLGLAEQPRPRNPAKQRYSKSTPFGPVPANDWMPDSHMGERKRPAVPSRLAGMSTPTFFYQLLLTDHWVSTAHVC